MQMDELERGQILERGTVSLPSMHNFRQELLKAPTLTSTAGGDLATWRRPGNTGSGEAPVSCSGISTVLPPNLHTGSRTVHPSKLQCSHAERKAPVNMCTSVRAMQSHLDSCM